MSPHFIKFPLCISDQSDYCSTIVNNNSKVDREQFATVDNCIYNFKTRLHNLQLVLCHRENQ